MLHVFVLQFWKLRLLFVQKMRDGSSYCFVYYYLVQMTIVTLMVLQIGCCNQQLSTIDTNHQLKTLDSLTIDGPRVGFNAQKYCFFYVETNTHFQQNKLYNLRRQLIDDSSVPILHPVRIICGGALTGFSESQIGYVLNLPLLTPHSNMGKQENHGSNETEPGCLWVYRGLHYPVMG